MSLQQSLVSHRVDKNAYYIIPIWPPLQASRSMVIIQISQKTFPKLASGGIWILIPFMGQEVVADSSVVPLRYGT
jgi:hypothetical protein